MKNGGISASFVTLNLPKLYVGAVNNLRYRKVGRGRANAAKFSLLLSFSKESRL